MSHNAITSSTLNRDHLVKLSNELILKGYNLKKEIENLFYTKNIRTSPIAVLNRNYFYDTEFTFDMLFHALPADDDACNLLIKLINGDLSIEALREYIKEKWEKE